MDRRKYSRQLRAAQRLQSSDSTVFPVSWNKSQIDQFLDEKLREFLALCRARVISLDNVYPASHNVLQGAGRIALRQECVHFYESDHQHWLAMFSMQGRQAVLEGLARRM